MRCIVFSTLFLFVHLTFVRASQTVLQADQASENGPQAHIASGKRVLTDEFKAFVQDITDKYKVPGLTLGVVHGGEVEFGAWGRRTEDDDEMTVDVSVRTSLVITSTLTRHHTFALPFIRHCSRSHHAPKRSSRPPSGS